MIINPTPKRPSTLNSINQAELNQLNKQIPCWELLLQTSCLGKVRAFYKHGKGSYWAGEFGSSWDACRPLSLSVRHSPGDWELVSQSWPWWGQHHVQLNSRRAGLMCLNSTDPVKSLIKAYCPVIVVYSESLCQSQQVTIMIWKQASIPVLSIMWLFHFPLLTIRQRGMVWSEGWYHYISEVMKIQVTIKSWFASEHS